MQYLYVWNWWFLHPPLWGLHPWWLRLFAVNQRPDPRKLLTKSQKFAQKCSIVSESRCKASELKAAAAIGVAERGVHMSDWARPVASRVRL